MANPISAASAAPRAPPQHVAIIMDGNGRWARARGLPRIAGHRRGAEAVRRTAARARELGIPYLTLFGFSSENWQRPSSEIHDLMGLLRHYLRAEIAELWAEIAELCRNGIRLKVIGQIRRLAPDIVSLIEQAEETTRNNSAITLTIALSYGGRSEIVAAVRVIAAQVRAGSLALDAVDEECLARHLFTVDLPDPDLLIRTSGEQRISNFLLWQCAYSELVFTKTLWPDFAKDDFDEAIDEYCGRERRYGAGVGPR
jgi:undecaprenyl diphosphate synthase